MFAGNCSWAARSGSGGSPRGVRPASDEIMRARLSLTSAHAPRRKARGVFCHVRGYHQKLRLFKPSPRGEGFARPDHPARGKARVRVGPQCTTGTPPHLKKWTDRAGGLCLSKRFYCPLGWQLWHCAPQWAQLPPQEDFPCRFWRIREREMKVTMAISTIEIKIVERFAPIQLNMENHSFAFANFGKAQALSVVASL